MFFNFILIFLSIISIANGTFKRKLETIVEEEDLAEEPPFKKINNSEKLTKRALVISTNFDSNNFKMNTIFANLLTKHFYVHYLIINTKKDDFKFEDENFSILDKKSIEINEKKNTFEIFNLSPKLKKDFSNYEFSKYYLGGGNIQEEKIKNQIERESFDIFKEIFYLGRDIINRSKNFNLGLFDSNNIGALFIFHAAGIKNVFCINNTPLKAYQFKYAGKEFPKNIPANLGKSKLKEILEHKQKGIDVHKKNEELYETLHEKMDNYFKFRFSIAKIDENTPSLSNLYSNIKAIFLNNDELTDFPLGDSKPENLFYVGGIHLNGLKELKNKLKLKKGKEISQIIISKETCKLFNDLRGLEVWNSLREVLRSFKDKFSFLYDCNKDQLINWKINKIGSETFKDIPNIHEELAKGNTKLLISTCNNYQVIEAFAFNVGIICIPYNENQFYNAKALNIDHPELETIKIGNKSKEYFKNLFNRMGTYLKGNTSQVSPRRSQTENDKEILNKNILVKIIIYYEEKFDVKKLFRIGLGKILENDNYMETVEKASIYLHEKWEKENPQNVFINKVLEN